MTTPVRVQQSIRQLETKGLTHTQIAKELGVSRTTVVKYATRDYSPTPTAGREGSRSLVVGEYARKADEWLEADRRMPRKQRHTARRVHERLVDECGFEGSYSSVQRWVKRWRQRHRGEAEGFSELEWAPGSAQVDFGQALAVIAGVERTVHFLVVSFPYSNMRYVAALPGETAECVCHGLNRVFSHTGMVPRVLVFDNATGVGHRRVDGTVTQTRLFSLFCAHYGFETRFCNPYSGWEKGSTENAVGFLRRNLMVIPPEQYDEFMSNLARRNHCNSVDEMYAAIGYGGLQLARILPKLKEEWQKRKSEEGKNEQLARVDLSKVHATDGVVVEGFDNTPIKFAKCCSPLPGDPIVGFITRGFGVSIHKQTCANAVASMKDPSNAPRWVKAYWADSVKDSYKAGLEIIALNRNELLQDVLSALADIRVPIYAMNARQVENNCAVVSLTIGINNTEHLNRVVARLSKVRDVLKVTRS